MNVNKILWLMVLLLLPLKLIALDKIPSESRIETLIVNSLTGPKDQPMEKPTDVAVDSTGRVFVADGVNNRILRFNSKGLFGGAISKSGEHTLSWPVGLTMDKDDHLWIADTGNHRLVVVTGEGKFIRAIDLPPVGNDKPVDPTDVAVTPDGFRTYVVDNDHHRILVRDNRTGLFSSLGNFGHSLGQFQWPFMICLGPDNYLFVSETIGTRIQKISPADRWAGVIGQWGIQLGQLYRPKGIAADSQGNIFVSDSTLNAVQVFNSNGQVKGVLTDREGNILRFAHPMGMCFDKKGRLYVVELAANRVTVVEIRTGLKKTPDTGDRR
ncbi:MAG: NHL repeat-containing protein [Phycisphaerae bacterium]